MGWAIGFCAAHTPFGRVRYLNPCRKLSEKGGAQSGWPDIENMILVFSNLNFKQVII